MKHGATSGAAALLAIVLVALLVAATPSAADARSPVPSVPASVAGAVPTDAGGGPGAPSITPASATLGSIVRTLVLYNETVFDSNASALATYESGTTSVAFDTDNDTGWVDTYGPQSNTGVVSVFDAATGVGLRQTVGGYNGAVAYDPANNTIWVTGGDTSDNVTVFNATTYGVVRVVGTGGTPEAIVYDNVSEEMFVVNFGSLNVTVINASTYVVQPIAPYVGEYPRGIAFDWKSRDLFVTHQFCTCSDNNVTVFYQSGNAAHSEVTFPSAGQEYTIVDDPQNDMV